MNSYDLRNLVVNALLDSGCVFDGIDEDESVLLKGTVPIQAEEGDFPMCYHNGEVDEWSICTDGNAVMVFWCNNGADFRVENPKDIKALIHLGIHGRRELEHVDPLDEMRLKHNTDDDELVDEHGRPIPKGGHYVEVTTERYKFNSTLSEVVEEISARILELKMFRATLMSSKSKD